MNDPNGMFYFEGEYHLFYQHNPFGDKWGHMSWGHAVSTDMLHWEHLPIALPEEDGVMIFSGSAVVDWNNSSGFGEGNQPPIVAIYSGRRNFDDRQFQCLAYSNDKGRVWVKYSNNPVLDIESNNFRDPKVFWYKETKKWVMVLALSIERKVQFYGSENLINWDLLSEFGPEGAVEGVWECPDLFQLPVINEEGKKKWVLEVGIGIDSVAGGSGGQYFVGEFDGIMFSPDLNYSDENNIDHIILADRPTHKALEKCNWVDYGKDFYAVVSWSDIPKSDGRRLWLGWMSNWDYAQEVPTAPWRSVMSIPREIRLKKNDQKYFLVQQPVEELKKLRSLILDDSNIDIDEIHSILVSSDLYEMECEIVNPELASLTITFNSTDDEFTSLMIDPQNTKIVFNRENSGIVDFNPTFADQMSACNESLDYSKMKIHVFIDKSSIEIFINDGIIVFTNVIYPTEIQKSIKFSSKGTGIKLSRMSLWKLDSVWKN
ncbi:MAG: glycoside hydrolase family 32 protein [Melioribacteraceae bacterium]|nr:glycoside hydrolase family 32 protein [Melioribacteraceae bacterium]MCF8264765.1 glycoside hydrolase family 32 protein [Melioribacteraceae bacterium]